IRVRAASERATEPEEVEEERVGAEAGEELAAGRHGNGVARRAGRDLGPVAGQPHRLLAIRTGADGGESGDVVDVGDVVAGVVEVERVADVRAECERSEL